MRKDSPIKLRSATYYLPMWYVGQTLDMPWRNYLNSPTNLSEIQEDILMGNHKRRTLLETDIKFQHPISLDQLTIYVDAAHVTDIKSQRSIGGHVAFMENTAVAHFVKWHHRLYPQHGPTIIFEDNAAAIMMANVSKSKQQNKTY
eukprot:60579-Ditylum_brightwellii.AAC.1